MNQIDELRSYIMSDYPYADIIMDHIDKIEKEHIETLQKEREKWGTVYRCGNCKNGITINAGTSQAYFGCKLRESGASVNWFCADFETKQEAEE